LSAVLSNSSDQIWRHPAPKAVEVTKSGIKIQIQNPKLLKRLNKNISSPSLAPQVVLIG
jgi:hypothetical protein